MATEPLESINPHNQQALRSWPQHSDQQVENIITAVGEAQRAWRRVDVTDRSKELQGVAASLRSNKDRYAKLMTEEMGKPFAQAQGEIEKCAWVSEYYADTAPGFLAPQRIETEAERSEVVFRPLGNVLAIMPWNFPFWQAFRFAVPALAAGNGVVLKHAANVSGCAMAIEEVFAAALPSDLLRTLLIDSSRVADVIGRSDIAAVTFTGSTGAGRKVAETAGTHLKKCVLELGGSDPYVVLGDADVSRAAEVCAKARLINSGQSCIAAKRFIVVDSVYEEFVEEFKRRFEALKTGNPFEDGIDVGPLARPDLASDLEQQVANSIELGAKIIVGDQYASNAYFQPTILVDVEPGMPAFDDELFGPVAAVIKAKSDNEAIALANNSPFGLAGAIFTAHIERGWQLACDELETGTVAVNGQVQSDPRLPFGGIKESGYGRELGEFGLREFVNIKTVSLF